MTQAARMVSRVVFDTSTLVSAALRDDSIPFQALAFAMRFCELCVSRQTLNELREVLSRDKFDRYLARAERERFVRTLEASARTFAVREGDVDSAGIRCRDLSDQKFLELALEADAATIVASDDDLLVLHPWHEIRILRPAEFVAAMREKA